jgi:hypothetical protein
MKTPYIAENADENSTAVATMPVPTNWTYSRPSTEATSVPSPRPKASR